MDGITLILTILIVVAAILLTLLVLIQNSKGGGLAAGFSSGNQVMGAPKTADFLEKASWTLAAFIVVLSIFAVGFSSASPESASNSEDAEEQEMSTSVPESQNAPAANTVEANL